MMNWKKMEGRSNGHLKILSQNFPEGTDEDYGDFSSVSRCPRDDPDWEIPRHKQNNVTYELT
jgi:hypothetical protein